MASSLRNRYLRNRLWKKTMERLGYVPCYVCNEHVLWEDATLEHIKPKSKGGSNYQHNLWISHKSCNEQKGDSWDKATKGVHESIGD